MKTGFLESQNARSGHSRCQKVSVEDSIQALQRARKHISDLPVFAVRPCGRLATEVTNMSSFDFNKIAMAFLGTIFIVFSLSLLSDSIFHAEAPEQPGYIIEVAESSGGSEEAVDTGPAFEPVELLLANADLAAGENEFKKCAACHSWEKGGANKVGPNLWDVVGSPIGSHIADYNYSAALKEYGAGGTVWTYEELNGFLWKPKTFIKGTAMGFAGLRDVEDRANLIAWLRSHSDTPQPLPGS